jgi:exodeoxyribonuclease III
VDPSVSAIFDLAGAELDNLRSPALILVREAIGYSFVHRCAIRLMCGMLPGGSLTFASSFCNSALLYRQQCAGLTRTRPRLHMVGERRSKRRAADPSPEAAAQIPGVSNPESPEVAEPPTTRRRLGPPTEAIPTPPAPPGYFKVMSYNVCSLRSMLAREAKPLHTLVATYEPDVLCLQETKMTDEAVAKLADPDVLPGYTVFWAHSSTAKGKHGVATLVKKSLAAQVSQIDGPVEEIICDEGRMLVLDVETEEHGSLTIINGYVPNSGGKLARLPYRTETFEPAMRKYLEDLKAKKGSVLYCGDLNCAHEEIDIHNSKGNRKNAGHTPEECAAFSEMLRPEGQYVDAFRAKYPHLEGAYTFWSARSKTTRVKNAGWRLDYFICDKELYACVHDVRHLVHIDDSDHCPLEILLEKR